MSSSSNSISSSVSGNWRRVGDERGRGMPRTCRCGQVSMIRMSGTSKNPGRLFHCCPHGSEGDKFHLFKWTDESMVEEIEDLKSMINDLKGDMSALKTTVFGYEKEIEGLKKAIIKCEGAGKECVNELRSFKNLMVCGIGMAALYYYFVC